jgi:ketosteroid isomerase-like protein
MVSATEVVNAINAAWRTGRVEELATHFDPAMVIVGPGYQPLARGADACVASYRDFLRASVVHDYRQSDLTAHEAGGVAIVTFSWEMEYEQGGRRSRESGTDLFVLRQTGERWQAVWRAVNFAPAG